MSDKMREAFKAHYGWDFSDPDCASEAETWNAAWQAALAQAEQPCQQCNGAGEIETDNNGPIVPCGLCRPAQAEQRGDGDLVVGFNRFCRINGQAAQVQKVGHKSLNSRVYRWL